MSVQPQIHAVIVGGGIGGLFAANALVAIGIRVSVYEQAPALGEVGAGLLLTPNGVRHLRRVGLGPVVERHGARIGAGSTYFRHDGTPIAPYLVVDSAGSFDALGMHRADLVEMLALNLPRGVVHTGHRCIGFEQIGETARVMFENGAQAQGDLVIGADGIHSAMRHYVAPPSRPVFSGSIVYRGLVPRERIPHWPTAAWMMWLGKGKHFLAYPVRADTLINYAGFVQAHEATVESWSAPGDPDDLRREFARWDPRIASLLGQVDATLRWALYDRDMLTSWTHGRLTLLGDAAHPMLPHVGQGANQSIEDGMALATILARADRTTIPAALLAYERIRRERVTAIQHGARENGRRYDSASPELGTRDAEIAAQAEFRRCLYAHDVVAEAQAAALALPAMPAAAPAPFKVSQREGGLVTP
jgi:salicylate hydroxylase